MAKLVSCKACSKEIVRGVKKCPSCGKDQRNWFMRHKIMSFLGVIVLFVIIANLAGGDGDKVASTSEETESVYKVGDVVDAKQLEVTVSNFEEMDQIGDPSLFGKEASDGATLVAIQYTMKNISDKPVGVFSYPNLNLVDEKGTKYSSDLDATSAYRVETKIDDSKVLSDLNPGISVTNVEVYEISKTSFAEGEWFIQIGNSKVQIK